MKNIIKGQDDLYYKISMKDANGEELLPSDLHAFTMQFFTSVKDEQYVEFTKDDLVDDVLRIDGSKLSVLQDGALRVRFLLGLSDQNYEDGSYDVTCERLTGYWLKTVKVKKDAVIDSSISENDTQGGE